MKQGQTTLKPSSKGFPPTVDVGSDDGAVNVFIGPVWVRISSVAPGDSYDVSVEINGNVVDQPAQSSYRNLFTVEATQDAIKDWQQGRGRGES